MSRPNTSHTSGFTSVELLVALFIAALFVAAGYQMFTAVSKDSSLARQRALASNLAKDTMQQRAHAATCSTTPSTSTDTVPTDLDLPKPTMQTVVSAPYGCSSASNIVKVQTTISFGQENSRKEVASAIFVAK